MIGFVSPKLWALLKVRILNNAIELEIEVIIDTGFSAFVTLPRKHIAALGLRFEGVMEVVLADGSKVEAETYTAQVDLDGDLRDVYVVHAESHPLIGMALLENCSLQIEVRDGGRVLVEAI